MVAVKAHLADRFLANPDASLQAILFYGSDAGLVSERAQVTARRIAERETPPGEIIRLDDADVDGDRDRLGVELRTIPMFGGRKVVRVTTGRVINAAVLKDLIDAGDLAGTLIVEAGNLKPTESLRATFEKAPHAAAVACYGDEGRDLEGLVREVLDGSGIAISPDARSLLVQRLGADRALSRAEIEKLALYAAGKDRIEIDDVDAIVGDVSELAVDRIVNAAASGNAAMAINEFARTVTAGESPQMVISAIQRHLTRLHRVRAEMDRGTGLDEALRQLRPPLHFKQRDVFAGQCRRWTRPALDKALAAAADALRTARRNSTIEEVIAERLLLSLASHGG
ncbi:MAG: DNA polymerase III subunit delta [Hyphomicrobiaceae bacterium]|nr:DNA polymerase III subunit delta [Hyphomicrobiaceae bacterium]